MLAAIPAFPLPGGFCDHPRPCKGRTSDQIDIVIYDRQYTPRLLDQRHHKYIPAEAVYAVFEVKPTLNKDLSGILQVKKIAPRCADLQRTSAAITDIRGVNALNIPQARSWAASSRRIIEWADVASGANFVSNHRRASASESRLAVRTWRLMGAVSTSSLEPARSLLVPLRTASFFSSSACSTSCV